MKKFNTIKKIAVAAAMASVISVQLLATSVSAYSSNTTGGTGSYYNSYTKLYYPNYDSAASASSSSDVTSYSATANAYFCMTNGKYYSSLADAEAVSGTSYVYSISNYSSSYSNEYYITRYYSSTSGKYYLSYNEALNNSKSKENVSSTKLYNTYNYWFCKEDGLLYSTKSQALARTKNSDESMVEYVYSSYYNYYNNYDYRYNNYNYYNNSSYPYYSGTGYAPTYSSYYGYYDYYGNYGYNGYYGNYVSPFYTTTAVSTGSAANGDPYISGYKKKAGWSYIANVINDKNDGSSVSVYMNKATSVPKSVLSELKNKNVDLVLTMSNGAKWTINGDDVSTAQNCDLTVILKNYAVPSALVKKASSGAVSTAQIKLGNDSSFGFSASVSLAFSTRRAGCTANLYQYNANNQSLTLIDSTTVSNSGSATFNDVTKGGDFLVVVK